MSIIPALVDLAIPKVISVIVRDKRRTKLKGVMYMTKFLLEQKNYSFMLH